MDATSFAKECSNQNSWAARGVVTWITVSYSRTSPGLYTDNRDVSLAKIAVRRRLAENFWSKILGGGSWSLNNLSIRLPYSNVIDFQILGRGGIAENQLP